MRTALLRLRFASIRKAAEYQPIISNAVGVAHILPLVECPGWLYKRLKAVDAVARIPHMLAAFKVWDWGYTSLQERKKLIRQRLWLQTSFRCQTFVPVRLPS